MIKLGDGDIGVDIGVAADGIVVFSRVEVPSERDWE